MRCRSPGTSSVHSSFTCSVLQCAFAESVPFCSCSASMKPTSQGPCSRPPNTVHMSSGPDSIRKFATNISFFASRLSIWLLYGNGSYSDGPASVPIRGRSTVVAHVYISSILLDRLVAAAFCIHHVVGLYTTDRTPALRQFTSTACLKSDRRCGHLV
jgi:hypothetical protein